MSCSWMLNVQDRRTTCTLLIFYERRIKSRKLNQPTRAPQINEYGGRRILTAVEFVRGQVEGIRE